MHRYCVHSDVASFQVVEPHTVPQDTRSLVTVLVKLLYVCVFSGFSCCMLGPTCPSHQTCKIMEVRAHRDGIREKTESMESRGRNTVAVRTGNKPEGLGQWEKHLKNKGKWKEKEVRY